MEDLHRKAIETAITIENRNLNFCRAVISKVNNNSTRQVFKQLAEDEAKHVGLLCHAYTGSENELVTLLNTYSMYTDPYYCSLLDSIDGDSAELEALRIARRERHACIELYTVFVDVFREPHVRDVFSRILSETHDHVKIIRGEHVRLMNAMAGTVQNVTA